LKYRQQAAILAAILAEQYWQSNIGRAILAEQYWQSNIGRAILAEQYWQSNIRSNIGRCTAVHPSDQTQVARTFLLAKAFWIRWQSLTSLT
jgi:hypothetical protein